ncbi:MAG: asparagine--tRNA ligase, partial [Candidatus Bathyarchaeota archaeon]
MATSFTSIEDMLDDHYVSENVHLRGWVHRKRESKNTIFVIVRDVTGIIQCTIKKDSPAWDEAEKLTIESSITLNGTVKKDARAPGGYELSVDKLSIVGLAETFPITEDQSTEFLRDVRHLWLRSR